MNEKETLSDTIKSLDKAKYDDVTISKYIETIDRLNILIEQGVARKKGYNLKSSEHLSISEVLSANKGYILA